MEHHANPKGLNSCHAMDLFDAATFGTAREFPVRWVKQMFESAGRSFIEWKINHAGRVSGTVCQEK